MGLTWVWIQRLWLKEDFLSWTSGTKAVNSGDALGRPHWVLLKTEQDLPNCHAVSAQLLKATEDLGMVEPLVPVLRSQRQVDL